MFHGVLDRPKKDQAASIVHVCVTGFGVGLEKERQEHLSQSTMQHGLSQ